MAEPVLTREQIGRLAELIAATALSRPVRGHYRRALFRATALGEKYPTVDFIVDVLGPGDVSLGFFFAQVKGTTAGVGPGRRLPIDVPLDRYHLLLRMPVPTFLIGVDVDAEASFIVAAHAPRAARISSITTAYDLGDDGVKIGLYGEVLDFWRSRRPARRRTGFKDVDQRP